jgi:hypothetical protein
MPYYRYRNTMRIGRRIPITIGIMLIFGVILTTSGVTLDLVDGQTNSTINQTSTNTTATPAMTTSAQDEASQSIRGAITETGEFLGNATEKVATSESARTIVNETSELLGNATVETQRFFSPKNN